MISELTEFSSVIGDIYDAAVDPRLWQQALASICNYVGGYAAVLFWHDAATQSSEALYLFNDHPAFTRSYFEKFLPMDPFFPASSFIETGKVYRSTLPTASFDRIGRSVVSNSNPPSLSRPGAQPFGRLTALGAPRLLDRCLINFITYFLVVAWVTE